MHIWDNKYKKKITRVRSSSAFDLHRKPNSWSLKTPASIYFQANSILEGNILSTSPFLFWECIFGTQHLRIIHLCVSLNMNEKRLENLSLKAVSESTISHKIQPFATILHNYGFIESVIRHSNLFDSQLCLPGNIFIIDTSPK